MATLTSAIDADDKVIRVSGDMSSVQVGLRFRLDDELLDLSGFDVHLVRAGRRPAGADRNRWIVNRGVGDSVPASHSAGATIKAAVSASVSGTNLSTPNPFADAGSLDVAALVTLLQPYFLEPD